MDPSTRTIKHQAFSGCGVSFVVVIRETDATVAWAKIQTLLAAGVRVFEITFTTPNAAQLIYDLAVLNATQYNHQLVIGAGTVLTEHEFFQAFFAGAVFFVAPVHSLTHPNHPEASNISDLVSTLDYAYSDSSDHNALAGLKIKHQIQHVFVSNKPELAWKLDYVPGALTPNEIRMSGLQSPTKTVKIFPASVFGPDYLKAIQKVFPNLQFMPSGGVNLTNLEAWLAAGAKVISVGGDLTNIKTNDQMLIEAQKYLAVINAWNNKNAS